MWQQTFEKEYTDISKEQVWQAWEDIINWPEWDSELEYCKLGSTPFQEGCNFILKPKDGPKVKITITRADKESRFIDQCKFFGATMTDDHKIKQVNDGVKIIHTISMSGPLAFLWIKLVGKKVANTIPEQTDNMIKYIRKLHA